MILVTGAGGTCGRELLTQLTHARIPFRAGYTTTNKADDARGRGIDAVVADFRRLDTLEAALRGIDTLFLLAGWSPDQASIETNMVRAATQAGVRRVVKQSVWDAGGEGYSFARIHRPVERELEASALSWTFLRPNGFMQNLSNFSSYTIRNQSALYAPAVSVPISHVDVRDIARVAIAALTQPGHDGMIYELSGPAALSYREMASTLSGLLGRTVSCVEVSREQLVAELVAGGAPEAYAQAVSDLARYYAEGHAARVTSDVRRVTGSEPVSFERFATDHLEAFRKEGST